MVCVTFSDEHASTHTHRTNNKIIASILHRENKRKRKRKLDRNCNVGYFTHWQKKKFAQICNLFFFSVLFFLFCVFVFARMTEICLTPGSIWSNLVDGLVNFALPSIYAFQFRFGTWVKQHIFSLRLNLSA